MNKKNIPMLVLAAIVIVCIAFLVKNLASPTPVPASPAASSIPSAPTEDQPAGSPGPTSGSTEGKLAVISIQAPKGTISTEVASTSDEQAQGLGDRASLASGSGMIFPFAYPGDYGFWMKDMHFPLDMVWISSTKEVVGVAYDVMPDSYPTVLYPPTEISYVLELNAGEAQKFGVATDTQLGF